MLSHETPAKKINTIFCYHAQQLDHLANSAAVTRENIAHGNPAKNKYRSGPVFFVVTLSKISWGVTVTLIYEGHHMIKRALACSGQMYIRCVCNFLYLLQF